MTIETTAHAWQLVACRKLHVLDRAVTLRAADVARGMERVIEAQIRLGDREPRDAIASRAAVTQVTECALPPGRARIGQHTLQIPMIAAVATVATGRLWQQRVGCDVTRACIFVARHAGHVEIFDVTLVIEADR